jgi:hypothetical protein
MRGEKLDSEFISYHPDLINSTVQRLKQFDLIHFIHPSPHPTKGNMNVVSPMGWLDLYSKTDGIKKIVTMHDVYWHKTNKWFILASEYIDLLVASQRPHFNAVDSYPTEAKKIWTYFPMIIPDDLTFASLPKMGDERADGMMAQQWIQWKGHAKIFEALDGFDGCSIHFYGGGKEYHDLLAQGRLQKFIKRDLVEDKEYEAEQPIEHIYHGFIPHDLLVEKFKITKFSIDGSTRGYNNYTHFEPMLYGCISVVHEDILAGADNTIPEDACVSYNWDNAKEVLHNILAKPKSMKKIAERAFEFIMNFKSDVIAKTILEALNDETFKSTVDISSRDYHEHKALQDVGFDCWGTVDESPEKKEDFDSFCAACPWLRPCRAYVNKHGIREVDGINVNIEKPVEEPIKTEEPVKVDKVEKDGSSSTYTTATTVLMAEKTSKPDPEEAVGGITQITINWLEKTVTVKQM